MTRAVAGVWRDMVRAVGLGFGLARVVVQCMRQSGCWLIGRALLREYVLPTGAVVPMPMPATLRMTRSRLVYACAAARVPLRASQ